MSILLLGFQLVFALEWQLQVMSSTTLDRYYQNQKTTPKRIAVCENIGEQLSACLWMKPNDSLKFQPVHLVDLSQMGMDRETAWTQGLKAMKAEVSQSRYQPISIAGTPYGYWASNRYDGFDSAALFFAHELEQIVPEPVLMAIPSRGTVLLWQEGSAEANKMIAVGVNEIYKASPLPVSPDLYKWDGERWRVWARGREQAK